MASSKKSSKKPKGSAVPGRGFLQDRPKDINTVLKDKNIKNPTGALGGQLSLNEYNAIQNANLNRPNEYTPYGSQTYERDPVTGQVTKRFNLSQGQQGIDNAQTSYDTQAIGGAQKSLGQFQNQGQFSYGGIPGVMGAQDLLGARQGVEDRLNNAWEQRNAPIFQRQQMDAEQRLRDQGLTPGTAAYNQQLQQLQQGQSDARTQAQALATQQGLAETQGLHGISLANRQQATGEYGQQYFAPLDAAAGQFQGVRGVVQPNFTPMANVNVGNVDIAGTYGGYKQLDINQQLANKPAPMAGGGGDAGNLFGGAVNAMLGGVGAGSAGAPAAGGGGYGAMIGNFGSGFGNGLLAGAYGNQNKSKGFLY